MSSRVQRSVSCFLPSNGCERSLALLLVLGALLFGGCVSVKAPDKIIIGGSESERANPERIPSITTVEEGRTELDKAYRTLRLLQEENHELKRERNRYKHERDECREKAEKSNDD